MNINQKRTLLKIEVAQSVVNLAMAGAALSHLPPFAYAAMKRSAYAQATARLRLIAAEPVDPFDVLDVTQAGRIEAQPITIQPNVGEQREVVVDEDTLIAETLSRR